MNTRKPDPTEIPVVCRACLTEAPLVDVRWWDLVGRFGGTCSGCHTDLTIPPHIARRPFVVAKRGAA